MKCDCCEKSIDRAEVQAADRVYETGWTLCVECAGAHLEADERDGVRVDDDGRVIDQ